LVLDLAPPTSGVRGREPNQEQEWRRDSEDREGEVEEEVRREVEKGLLGMRCVVAA
jgi:hypothetical protein